MKYIQSQCQYVGEYRANPNTDTKPMSSTAGGITQSLFDTLDVSESP